MITGIASRAPRHLEPFVADPEHCASRAAEPVMIAKLLRHRSEILARTEGDEAARKRASATE